MKNALIEICARDDNLKLLTSEHNLGPEFAAMSSRLQPGDTLLVFAAGHGAFQDYVHSLLYFVLYPAVPAIIFYFSLLYPEEKEFLHYLTFLISY